MVIINYSSSEDKLAAELLQKRIGGRIIRGFVEPTTLREDLVVLGGQEASPTYDRLANGTFFGRSGLRVIREITPGDAGQGIIFVTNISGRQIWTVAGWLRGDTISAAEHIFLRGLPSSDTNILSLKELKLIGIKFSEVLPGGLNRLANRLDTIFTLLRTAIPGFTIRLVSLNGNTLEILVRSDSSFSASAFFVALIPFIPEILSVLSTLIITVGVIVTGWFINNIVTGKGERESIVDTVDFLEKKGFTKEQINEFLGGVNFSKILSQVGLILLVGVGGFFVFQSTSATKSNQPTPSASVGPTRSRKRTRAVA